jgi:arylsulfatase A-like enzyme
MTTILAVMAFSLFQVTPAHPSAGRTPTRAPGPNIVLIIADDCGVDLIGAYGEGAAPPCTPNIDQLATDGMLFRNAWANPVCSPSRAAILTGRYGFRTGIGTVVATTDAGLSLDEETIPEMLVGYESTCAGKWHLAGSQGPSHPNLSGFDDYAGSLHGGVANYMSWSKVTNGSTAMSTTYATTDTANEAIAAMSTMREPWFLMVAFNAPHSPYHEPPASLCPTSGCASPACGALPASPTDLEYGNAMLEALDTEIGRVLAALDSIDPRAWVFFMGDNGSAQAMSQSPFLSTHAKDTVYEGGVNVPFIVRGPGVVHGESSALVSGVDLFATFAQLAHVPSGTEDSVSMVPCFTNPSVSPRDTVYTESFTPNDGTLPFTTHERAARRKRYKLIRVTGQRDEFYDLLNDPFETTNLLPGLSPQQQIAYDALVAELTALGVG